MIIVACICAGLLAIGGIAVATRVFRGPALLDRVVAMDTLLAIVACSLGTMAAITQDSTLVPVIIVVALLGFIGSVSVALLLDPDQD